MSPDDDLLPAPVPEDSQPEGRGQFLLYQTEDGATRLEVRMEAETVWLTQRLLAELFQISVPTVNHHLTEIYSDGELSPEATIRKYLIVQTEGARQVRRMVDHYSLEVILAVGYRVRSLRGTQFRQWATQRLSEFVVKGFTMDDERLKAGGDPLYFEELLRRIRDIRASEKLFYRKVLDIYATSIDYDKDSPLSQEFFATVQNKMHWAAHGHTAAEIIQERADARQPNMGLQTYTGDRPNRQEARVAKNYLHEPELDLLNRLVTMYLDFAEFQALNRVPMHMKDWVTKLDEFLKFNGREVLKNAGRISSKTAQAKADAEFDKFRALEANKPSPVERHFDEAIQKTKRLEKERKSEKPRKRKGEK